MNRRSPLDRISALSAQGIKPASSDGYALELSAHVCVRGLMGPSNDSFNWKLVEAAPKLQSTMEELAGGVLLRVGDIWMLGRWDRGGWSRLTEGASWPIAAWHPTQWAEPDQETFMMLMAE